MATYMLFFFFSSRRRHTRSDRDWSSDVCSSDLGGRVRLVARRAKCLEQELLGATFAREDQDFFPLCHCLTFLPTDTHQRTKPWCSQRSILEENPPPRDAGGAGLTSPQKGAKGCHIQRPNASG